MEDPLTVFYLVVANFTLSLPSLMDFGTVLPAYVAVTLSLCVFLQTVLPDDIVPVALDPVQYSDGVNPWIVVSNTFHWLCCDYKLLAHMKLCDFSFIGLLSRNVYYCRFHCGITNSTSSLSFE